MTQEIARQDASKTTTLRVIGFSTPVVLVLGGLGLFFFLHFYFLGILGFLCGLGILGFRKLNSASQLAVPVVNPEDATRKEIKKSFYRLQGADGCESRAEKALDQLTSADERLKSYLRLLSGKLSPSEITFARYESAGKQVYFSVLDALTEIKELLISIESSHPTETAEKLKISPEMETLKERLALVKSQQEKVDQLLGVNETALTEMDKAISALTEMKTQAGLSTGDLEFSLKQLEELAKRASKYSS